MELLSSLRRPLWSFCFVLVFSALIIEVPDHAVPLSATPAWKTPEALPASEFSRIIQEFSEPDGYFRSDNFTSNETSYLTVVDKLRELGVSGGAYIGVGPEQNFTYIAKIRPTIAFIIDIRRQAIIQHLLYKAVFHQAATRAQFLSALLSRPIGKPIPRAASTADLVEYFSNAPAPEDVFAQNLSRVRGIIEKDFRFPMDERDGARLEYVYSAFRRSGLGISYRFSNMEWSGYGVRRPLPAGGWFGYPGQFPTLGDLMLQQDPNGRLGNFLASDDDYNFVRRLHELNRIIPVVGDFAGPKALSSIGSYLAKNRISVSAFYTSNVEQFLFQNGVYDAFVANVKKLPVDSRSVFIRAVARMRQVHPAYQPGQRTTTLLQRISVFLRDEGSLPYRSYWEMVTSHYIAGSNDR